MTTHHRLHAVENACANLRQQGSPITFTAISTITGISRSTLYRNTTLRAIIDEHRRTSDSPMVAITDELATLRAAVTSLADTVRHHDEQLRRLRN